MRAPIVRYSSHAQAAPGANTNIFTAITPSQGTAQVRVFISLATGSVFNLRLTDGTDAYTIKLNSGTALTAGVAYAFDIPLSAVPTEDNTKTITYSLQVATDSVIQHLEVWELAEPVA